MALKGTEIVFVLTEFVPTIFYYTTIRINRYDLVNIKLGFTKVKF